MTALRSYQYKKQLCITQEVSGMGGIFKENEQINKESVFRTGTQKELSKGMQLYDNVQPVSRSKSSRDLLRNAPVNEKKNESAEDIIGPEQAVSNEEYLERILQNSAAKNLALRVRQERELQQDAWVNVPDEKTYQFHQHGYSESNPCRVQGCCATIITPAHEARGKPPQVLPKWAYHTTPHQAYC